MGNPVVFRQKKGSARSTRAEPYKKELKGRVSCFPMSINESGRIDARATDSLPY